MAKKKTSKKAPDHNILFEVFCGEAIDIMLDQSFEQTEQNETTVKTLKASIRVQGFLIEIDDNFLYLGYDPEIISQAVPRHRVVHIELMTDPDDQILLGGPKSDGGLN
jgi:hypothetical protein